MKKKWLSLALVFALVMLLLPAGVLAAEDGEDLEVTVLLQPVEPFTVEEGPVTDQSEDGYIPYLWNGTEMAPADPVAVYVVTLPEDTETVNISFTEPVLAYNYQDGATYLAGEYEDIYTGVTQGSFPVDANADGAPDYIQVQSPYDESWNTSVLYAITFVVEPMVIAPAPMPFTVEEGQVTDQSEDGYIPYLWNGTEMAPADPVAVYVVTLPEDTETVNISFHEPVLAYNYQDGATYLAGEYEDIYTGVTQGSFPVDANADGAPDYIQVQSPYDESWNTSVLYAITFVYAAAEPAARFSDVEGHWAADAIDLVAERGLFQGTGEGKFSPDDSMSRAMLVTVLYRMTEDAAPEADSFDDVAEDAWYADAAAWAKYAGIVQGNGSGFAPDTDVDRQQLAAMLYRFVNYYYDVDTETLGDLSGFQDGETVADWALEAVQWAVGAEVLRGTDQGLLQPEGTATRAEVAVMLQRLLEIVE